MERDAENAARSKSAGHGVDLLARNLAALHKDLAAEGRALQLHLVGHSAGSLLLGHLLDRLARAKPAGPAVHSCTLFAPACSVAFAVEEYLGASSVLDPAALQVAVLSDENEKRDPLPSPALPAYGKSLLYLVSRALDDRRKMPLLGLARAHDPRLARDPDQWHEKEFEALLEWQRVWPQANLQTIGTPRVECTREHHQIQSTHGSFDNNIAVLTATLERIKGAALVGPMEWLDY